MRHIYKGVLFIYDRHHFEHAGFICAKWTSCIVVGGSRSGANRHVSVISVRWPCSYYLLQNFSVASFRNFWYSRVVIHYQGLATSRHLPQGPHPQDDFNAEAWDIMVCSDFFYLFWSSKSTYCFVYFAFFTGPMLLPVL